MSKKPDQITHIIFKSEIDHSNQVKVAECKSRDEFKAVFNGLVKESQENGTDFRVQVFECTKKQSLFGSYDRHAQAETLVPEQTKENLERIESEHQEFLKSQSIAAFKDEIEKLSQEEILQLAEEYEVNPNDYPDQDQLILALAEKSSEVPDISTELGQD